MFHPGGILIHTQRYDRVGKRGEKGVEVCTIKTRTGQFKLFQLVAGWKVEEGKESSWE